MKVRFTTRCLFAAIAIVAILLSIDRYMETKVGTLDSDFKSAPVRGVPSDRISPEGWSVVRESILDTTTTADRLMLCRRVKVRYEHATSVSGYWTKAAVSSDVRVSPFGFRLLKSCQDWWITLY